ncbi:23S rRNA (uracil(1939)-C(5))-methyltransferase RlmD [Eisenbergiella sp.]
MEKKRGNEMTGRKYKNGGNSREDGKRRENKSSNAAAQNFIGKDSVSKRVNVRKDRITSGRPSDGRGAAGRSSAGRYKDEKEKSAADRSMFDKTTDGKSVVGRNISGKSAGGKAVSDKNMSGKSADGKNAVKKYTSGQDISSGRQQYDQRNKSVSKKYEVDAKSDIAQRSGRRETKCPYEKKCGSCRYLYLSYEDQLKKKEAFVRQELEKCPELKGHFNPIIGMENPWNYRNKVTAIFDRDRKGNPVSGVYEEGTHYVIPVERCLIEDELADRIIGTIRGMLKSFKIKVYDEDTRYGLLRYVLVRRAFATGEVMVVLVTASPVLPSKRNFTNALLKAHPEITTVIQNVNTRTDSLILGDKQQILYGKGYIEDVLCGCRFRISPASFYQINPVQTEKLYKKTIELAGLKGTETVIDAYCGIGTIGLIAASHAKNVISVELNPNAVKDAIVNAKINGIKNVRFYKADAGQFLTQMAEEGAKADVLLMDPPRSGSTEEFLQSAALLGPEKIVYISCNPVTLGRDLMVLRKLGYRAEEVWPVDMFPWTIHCEVCVKICRKQN